MRLGSTPKVRGRQSPESLSWVYGGQDSIKTYLNSKDMLLQQGGDMGEQGYKWGALGWCGGTVQWCGGTVRWCGGTVRWCGGTVRWCGGTVQWCGWCSGVERVVLGRDIFGLSELE